MLNFSLERQKKSYLHSMKDWIHPDVIVVDPPRKGCDAILLNTMLDMASKRIVYVSCDPATLARDLKILWGKIYLGEGIRGRSVQPLGFMWRVFVL